MDQILIWIAIGVVVTAWFVMFVNWLIAMPPCRKYTWKPDRPDVRDHAYEVPAIALPTLVDNRKFCPPVYDQQSLGACTGNGIAGALETDMIRQNILHWTPSRLFIYYNERVLEGTVNEDSGAMIRDGIKTVAKWGFAPETMWPYIISKFKTKPSPAAYAEAAKHKISAYKRLDNTKLNDLKACLAAGNVIVFGCSVYESFESRDVADTGVVPMPQPGEASLGGHCMMLAGYSDIKNAFIVRNSWGAGWGDRGYCYMPYAFLTNPKLASDFWCIMSVPR